MKKKEKKIATRALSVRLRTARGRTNSSQRWLSRQLSDPYVQQAQAMGLRSRAAFKLIEMDERFHFLKPGMRVVDLGAAPGGWSQVAIKRITSKTASGELIAIDLLEMSPLPNVTFIQGDFLEPTNRTQLKELIQSSADVVLSDMAAPTSGYQTVNHLRTLALAESAFFFAKEILAPGGTFVTKFFQGASQQEFVDLLKKHFTQVKHVKPPSSRKESSEMFLIAMGFRP